MLQLKNFLLAKNKIDMIYIKLVLKTNIITFYKL